MKKSTLLLLLLSILALWIPAHADTSIQPEAGDFPKDQAVRIATEQFLKASGLDQSSLQGYTIVADLYEAYKLDSASMPRRWQIVFSLTDHPDLWYTVLIASPSGAFVSAEPNDFSSRLSAYRSEEEGRAAAMEQGETWIKEKGPWLFWSYEDKAAFARTFGRFPDGAPADIGLPGDGDVPLDQAVSVSKAAIAEHFSASLDRLNELKLDAQFIPEYNTVPSDSPAAWILGFHDPVVNTNGEYTLLYQAIIVSPGGAIERIYKMDYRGKFDKEPVVYSWPPEGHSAEEAVVSAGTVYFNSRGGKYYHMDAQCPSISPEYFPLTAIDINQLTEKPYNVLLPCRFCVK